MIIGTYVKSKNLWIWSPESQTLNKSILTSVVTIKDQLLLDKNCDHLKKFITMLYYVASTNVFVNILTIIAKVIYNVSQKQIITTATRGNDFIDIMIVEKNYI